MGKFVVKKTPTGIKFDLRASNFQILATSEVYSSRKACLGGIQSVKKNCGAPIEDQTLKKPEELKNPKYEVYKDKAGEFRFRLRAPNGENIAAANDGYKTKAGCIKGIESIKENAPKAETIDE